MVRATLRDVSREAGVSTYTASQALSGKPGLSEGTRERVLKVAAELGYVRNHAAANLKGAASHTVGVMTANGRNQYYALLVQGINAELQTHGYLAISNDAMRAGEYEPQLEREALQGLLQQRVAGVIATYSLLPESIELLDKWQIPVVFVDTPPPAGYEHKPFIGADNYEASQLVAKYLADLGHKRTLLLAFPSRWTTRLNRESGFTDYAKTREMDYEVIEASNEPEAAADLVQRRISDPKKPKPDAIYAMNTVLLQGALKALATEGLKVPDDISVVAFDEFEWAEHLNPPMTVVDQHIGAIGATAGKAIIQYMAKMQSDSPAGAKSKVAELQKPELIIRGSCADRN